MNNQDNHQFFHKINFSKSCCKNNLYSKGTEKLIKYGFINQIGAGLFTYLPKGIRVLNKLMNVVRKVFNKIGCQEVLFPTLHPGELWEKSGRLTGAYQNEKLIITDRNKKQLVYGPTSEEPAHDLAIKYILSQNSIPTMFYNIQWKFRDEIRPKNGIMRSREFLMFDGYSFHTPEQTDEQFEILKHACLEVFEILNASSSIPLNCICSFADGAEIGGDESYEIIIPCPEGETEFIDKDNNICKGIEVGHIFKLKNTYIDKMQCDFGFPVHSGCFGLGISRILGALAEMSAGDEIILPEIIAPYKLSIIPYKPNIRDMIRKNIELSDEIYFDDRLLTVDLKFKDAFNSGISAICIIGEKELAEQKVKIQFKNHFEYINIQDLKSF